MESIIRIPKTPNNPVKCHREDPMVPNWDGNGPGDSLRINQDCKSLSVTPEYSILQGKWYRKLPNAKARTMKTAGFRFFNHKIDD